jgi:hypothetical protein
VIANNTTASLGKTKNCFLSSISSVFVSFHLPSISKNYSFDEARNGLEVFLAGNYSIIYTGLEGWNVRELLTERRLNGMKVLPPVFAVWSRFKL